LCAHILPKELQWLNILEPFRKEIRAYAGGRLKLHKYFHHLNSSQAFALNLFFPFFEAHRPESRFLIAALGLSGEAADWAPEYVVDREEGTNVDVAWRDKNQAWIFCEVKLTEQEFGRAAGEERHHLKLRNKYVPFLPDHCASELLESAAFFGSYQILRNVWLAARDPGTRVLFLMPKQNEVLWEPLHKVLSCLAPGLRARINAVSIEQVLEQLSGDDRLTPQMRWYVSQLAEKYALPAA